ncbi:hypothetical protein GUITHDRAFT_100853 [Guillardia theta CCMP2712]|uniref:protein-tyrosine-phosphatase n=1 Tax=Guillardia theta (strain CCMP2712) TaxID=905079 RepID=L1K019_GUITC|nr:hypothetical protein GUITHDRAFT_100853 [Guillardia theta CCMP2712]EKX53889.1 hypothetical protein GUITHDRAFT_100853 [Guillardia theta CCMP2712]|eukprot:XP_005840869.1 hypothetical protein GUITHDRAFT_100853 [Guillardia theta CCMP2712]
MPRMQILTEESCSMMSITCLAAKFLCTANERKPPLIVDVRPHKEFHKGNVCGAFCVSIVNRGNRRVLEDSSLRHDSNDHKDLKRKRERILGVRGLWQPSLWMGRELVLYGSAALTPEHEVVRFLQSDEFTLPRLIRLLDVPFDTVLEKYPGLCTTFGKPREPRRYPAEVIPGELYLGDWDHAKDETSLDHLNVRSVITIHQRPKDISFGSKRQHLRLQQDDVDTDGILQHIDASNNFIERAISKKHATLVHCGAGISRSASLCVAYLIHRFKWPASRAVAHVVRCRKVARPNEGFMKALHDYQKKLGIADDKTADEGKEKENPVIVDEQKDKNGDQHVVEEAADPVPCFVTVYKDETVVDRVELPGNSKLTLGRSLETDIVMEHPSVSRQHAILQSEGQKVYILDLGSAHGTKVNSRNIEPERKVEVKDGDVLEFGASTRKYVISRGQKESVGMKRSSETQKCPPNKRQKEMVGAYHILIKHKGEFGGVEKTEQEC